jgi:hypothetical protein
MISVMVWTAIGRERPIQPEAGKPGGRIREAVKAGTSPAPL